MAKNLDIDINYIQSNSKEKNILLLHGWGGSLESFQAVFDYFKKSYTVTAIDFCGFGKSPPPPYPFGVADYALMVYAFLQAKNIKKTHIIAHSFGGRVAIELAYMYPEIIDKLILTSSAGLKKRKNLKHYINILRYKLAKKFKKDLTKFGSADYKAAKGVMKDTFVKIVNCDQTHRLKHIKAPTLLIWGQNDTETPLYMAKKMNRLIKRSKLIIIRGTGHFAYRQKSLLFIKHCERFLGEKDD
ncbi:MAG TPA: alpha/beta hydrolase [Clostridiales bacterium]|nr:alpha/beta hydrolase [Clostridiales bacterium]